MHFLLTYSLPSSVPFHLQTFSTRLPVVWLKPKVQTNGPTHYALPAPNLLSFAVPAQRKHLPSRNGRTLLKKRTGTRISNNFVKSSSVLLTSSVPSTVNPVWTLCSLPSSNYAIRTHLPGILHSHSLPLVLTDARYRTSHRLNRSDRMFSNPVYHPYAHPSSADSQTLNISTPSSTTLHSSRSAATQWKKQPSNSSFRRSVSTMSTNSSSSLQSLPRAPVRRTDSFGEARKAMKRAPSFSVAAKGSDVSSDEEENLRTKQTKKARRGADQRIGKTLSSSDDSPARRPRMNLQRNPSMFGPELPHRSPPPTTSHLAPAHLSVQIPAMGAHPPPPTPPPRTPCTQRTLRRMRPIPPRAPRRISFSSQGENDVVSEPVDIIPSEGLGHGLDSAFQLR